MAPGTAHTNRFCNASKKDITNQGERRSENRSVQRLIPSMVCVKQNKGSDWPHIRLLSPSRLFISSSIAGIVYAEKWRVFQI
jgi:hypothetical protein